MDDVQLISEIIIPGDYGMLLDLKDAYLTLGLHLSHRKYCRFRDPQTGQLQWRTVSFDISEAPRLYTKLLRPLIAKLHIRSPTKARHPLHYKYRRYSTVTPGSASTRTKYGRHVESIATASGSEH
jgi:hypothetical protein